MKKILLYFLLVLSIESIAQSDSTRRKYPAPFEHDLFLGFNVGATTPLSLPATIRKIDSWSPAFNPSLGYEFLLHIRRGWRLGIGAKIDYKGMTVKDKVMYMHTKITVENGSSTGVFEGDFSGRNKTVIRNAYMTFPLYVAYNFNYKWRVKLGGYAAYLFRPSFKGKVYDGYMRNGSSLGEKIIVTEASFDLSAEQKKWDSGIMMAGERLIGKHLGIMGNFTWGLQPLFPKNNSSMDFKMYNFYLTLGLCYRL